MCLVRTASSLLAQVLDTDLVRYPTVASASGAGATLPCASTPGPRTALHARPGMPVVVEVVEGLSQVGAATRCPAIARSPSPRPVSRKTGRRRPQRTGLVPVRVAVADVNSGILLLVAKHARPSAGSLLRHTGPRERFF